MDQNLSLKISVWMLVFLRPLKRAGAEIREYNQRCIFFIAFHFEIV